MNNIRTQKMVNKMKVQRKPSYLTLLALVIYIFSDHLLLQNFVNGQISRRDYRSGFLVTNPCVSKQTCSQCLQTPTCSWCMKENYTSTDGAPLPRCNQERFYTYGDLKGYQQSSARNRCPPAMVEIIPEILFHIHIELIQESICDCEKPGNPGYIENARQCSGHGTYKCGICECPPDYFGRRCECDAENLSFHGDLEAGCRPDNTTTTLCNIRGDCICGKCECYPRENPLEVVSGDYCECDNFSCDRYNGELCSGPDHGVCQCGKCVCNSEWDSPGYTACECRASNDTCITPYGQFVNQLCSGHGTCECGKCKCDETAEGQYSGQFCEDCPTCPNKCEELKPCVQCKQFLSGPYMDEIIDRYDDREYVDDSIKTQCDLCAFTPVPVERAEDYLNDENHICTFFDDDECQATFVYGYNNATGTLEVMVQKTKECPLVVDIMGIVLGVIGAIVAIGLALILMWKVFTTIHDRREFARFEKERMLAKWDTGENPIFKQATSTFKNPTYAGK